LAFSGGVDSTVLLNILLEKKIDVTLLTVDHGTDYSFTEVEFAFETSVRHGLEIVFKDIPKFDKSTSLESFWSRKRNLIFQSMDKPVLTGHHLNDAVEWYFMTFCQGNARVIHYQNENVLRPLIITPKEKIIKYAEERKIEHLTDPTNSDSDFNLRNKIRNNVLPVVKTAFPGLETTVRKILLNSE
jgi:tRNA(Ile)-lysidine synthase